MTQNKPPVFTNFALPASGLPRTYTSLVKVGKDEYLVGTESGEICLFVGGVFKEAFIVGKGKVYSLATLHNQIDIITAVGT